MFIAKRYMGIPGWEGRRMMAQGHIAHRARLPTLSAMAFGRTAGRFLFTSKNPLPDSDQNVGRRSIPVPSRGFLIIFH
jgi:hypothetical protein